MVVIPEQHCCSLVRNKRYLWAGFAIAFTTHFGLFVIKKNQVTIFLSIYFYFLINSRFSFSANFHFLNYRMSGFLATREAAAMKR